ncbi:FAD-dependent tricarballylate dehydrogenase TcuA [Nocardioides humi]|uniref:FAD-dependent tricarballylate dehydrogenase TcuA n=1 Tax=Nocardioides humi TaxID=449461 RepID=A0ABN2AAY4_9ACTN
MGGPLTLPRRADVVVVGAGNAALCSAITAVEAGASVVVLEKAPRDARGGNGAFTGGFLRFAFDGIEDLRSVVDLTAEEERLLEVGRYSPEDFFLDVAELCDYRSEPDLVDLLVSASLESVRWLRTQGVHFLPTLGLHAPDPAGVVRMRGVHPAVEVSGGGAGLLGALFRRAESIGLPIHYATAATRLVTDDAGRVTAVTVREGRVARTIEAGAVVLACGGFESDPELRARYLGTSWDLARVRGAAGNTGDGIRMARDVGAQAAGHWSGCHAAPLDLNAPLYGDRDLSDAFVRRSYHLGVLVNRDGERFLDEGADLEARTYSWVGQRIIEQPGQVAFQVFDARAAALLRPEYALRQATRLVADTVAELAAKAGVNAAALERTVDGFNAGTSGAAVDPRTIDGVATTAVSPPKSNWAASIVQPPFVAYPVTAGITFTFGGVRVDADAQVVAEDGEPIGNLCAAGEMVGGLFFGNYPTGCGIMAGTVFGRTAGRTAAALAASAT